jgi:hypothetical protein
MRGPPASPTSAIVFHHLARHYAAAYLAIFAMVDTPGADQSFSTIAMGLAVDPLRAAAARAFAEYFFSVADTVYPGCRFANAAGRLRRRHPVVTVNRSSTNSQGLVLMSVVRTYDKVTFFEVRINHGCCKDYLVWRSRSFR